MTEYQGLLEGGPDNGNFVTVLIDRIPVVITIETHLSGTGEDKPVRIEITTGAYWWQKNSQKFKWFPETSSYFTRTKE